MTSFANRNFGKWASKTIKIDAAALERAKKVFALAERGATDGEKNAALSRLASIADKAGISVENLVRACA